ncbi:MAG TPA: AAA family ATPase, partial [Acidimicrobiales bacterium]|nr:AAA family ATPase [Acidimicrobiales bacterium]
TAKGQVLYVGTEDDAIELHDRYGRLIKTASDEPSDDLDLATNWPKASEGAVDEVRKWCASCENPVMVTFDVVAKVEPRFIVVRRGWVGVLEALEPWIKLAREENIAVVLVTHNNRGRDVVENPIEQVQGSGGLTAYAQTVIVMQGAAGVPERQLDYGGKFGHGQIALTIDSPKMSCTLRNADITNERETSAVRSLLLRLVRRNPGLKARTLGRMLPGRTVDSTVRMLQLMADDGELTVIDRHYFAPDSEEAQQLNLGEGVRLLAS